jgi:HSP20 family molecular chaperone IbpA
LIRREPGRLGDLFDWFGEEFFPLFGQAPGRQMMRVEDYVEDGKYVVRAELPGIDPGRDVDVTVANGVLTVSAERREEKKEVHRSEFRYGAFRRSLALPPDTDESDIEASYHNGILEVRVGLKKEERPEPKHIPIAKE